MVKFTINGTRARVDVDADTPLLWVIRDSLKMTGTKFGCGVASCGACTVYVNGEPVRACQTAIEDVDGATVTTIEGLESPAATAIRKAWVELNVPQCGYCQSGQIMSASRLLEENNRPSDADIDEAMSGNLCRCATYVRIRDAIHRAADLLEG